MKKSKKPSGVYFKEVDISSINLYKECSNCGDKIFWFSPLIGLSKKEETLICDKCKRKVKINNILEQ